MSYLVALSLSVLLATGTPCESTIVEGTQYGVPGETRSIVTYDADFDLRPDIVATVAGTNALTLLSNRSAGFHAVPVALSHPAELVIVADVDGDSVNELLAVGPVNLSTLFANGDGTFRIVPNTFSGAPIDLFLDRRSSTGDVTGDGKLDFVALSSRSTAFPKPLLRVFAGGGDGTFTHLASPELPRGVDMISIGGHRRRKGRRPCRRYRRGGGPAEQRRRDLRPAAGPEQHVTNRSRSGHRPRRTRRHHDVQ